MKRHLSLTVLLAAVAVSCEAEPESPGAEQVAANGVDEAPAAQPPVLEQEPQPEAPTPDLPQLDAETVGEIEVRIVDRYDRAGWAPCGVIHSVGAIEVEVLGYGNPAPRMVLFVSCPVDFGNRELLEEDAQVHVTLYGRRQPWPKPMKGYRTDLPVRYVKQIDASQAG